MSWSIANEHSTAQPVRVESGARVVLDLEMPAPQRGLLTLDSFEITTRHPFGLFRAWAYLNMNIRCVVYPKPSPRGLPPPPLETDTGGAQDTVRGDEDFAGLRAFHPGDSPRRIAWKAYAREQGLQVKVFAGTAVTSHSFDWDSAHRPRHRGAAVAAVPLGRGCLRGRPRLRIAIAGSRDPTERRSGSSAALLDGAGTVRRARDPWLRLRALRWTAADEWPPTLQRLVWVVAGLALVGGAARSARQVLDPAARRRRRGTADRHRGQALADAAEMAAQHARVRRTARRAARLPHAERRRCGHCAADRDGRHEAARDAARCAISR